MGIRGLDIISSEDEFIQIIRGTKDLQVVRFHLDGKLFWLLVHLITTKLTLIMFCLLLFASIFSLLYRFGLASKGNSWMAGNYFFSEMFMNLQISLMYLVFWNFHQDFLLQLFFIKNLTEPDSVLSREKVNLIVTDWLFRIEISPSSLFVSYETKYELIFQAAFRIL